MQTLSFSQIDSAPSLEGKAGGASAAGNESPRWGIIYCPKQGVRRTHKRWEHIKELLDANEIAYDFVQSEGAESVLRLTKMLVTNGYETLIIVGGDSALNRALNGLLSFDDDVRQRVCIGVIPNGRGNDFASFWGYSEDDDQRTVRWLMERRVRKVDVGYIKAINQPANIDVKDESNHDEEGNEQALEANNVEQKEQIRYFLNCVNVGLVANIMKLKYKARRIFGLTTLTYFASMILLLFQRLEIKMKLRINEEHIDRKLMSVCIGNCRAYGQTPNAVPYNGMLDVSVISCPGVRQLIEGLGMLFTGKFLSHKSVKAYRTPRTVIFSDIRTASVSADGIVLSDYKAPFEIGLKTEHINFIIPS